MELVLQEWRATYLSVKRILRWDENSYYLMKVPFSDQASGIFAQIKRPGPTQILEGFVYFYRIYQIFDKSSDIYLALTMMLEGGPDWQRPSGLAPRLHIWAQVPPQLPQQQRDGGGDFFYEPSVFFYFTIVNARDALTSSTMITLTRSTLTTMTSMTTMTTMTTLTRFTFPSLSLPPSSEDSRLRTPHPLISPRWSKEDFRQSQNLTMLTYISYSQTIQSTCHTISDWSFWPPDLWRSLRRF